MRGKALLSNPILPETQPAWTRFPAITSVEIPETGFGEGGFGEDGFDSPAIPGVDVPTPIWVVEILQ